VTVLPSLAPLESPFQVRIVSGTFAATRKEPRNGQFRKSLQNRRCQSGLRQKHRDRRQPLALFNVDAASTPSMMSADTAAPTGRRRAGRQDGHLPLARLALQRHDRRKRAGARSANAKIRIEDRRRRHLSRPVLARIPQTRQGPFASREATGLFLRSTPLEKPNVIVERLLGAVEGEIIPGDLRRGKTPASRDSSPAESVPPITSAV